MLVFGFVKGEDQQRCPLLLLALVFINCEQKEADITDMMFRWGPTRPTKRPGDMEMSGHWLFIGLLTAGKIYSSKDVMILKLQGSLFCKQHG